MKTAYLKNRVAMAAISVTSGTLTAAGPWSLFKICSQGQHHGGGLSACFYTARAEIGVGILLALLGVAYLLFSDPQTRAGLSIGLALVAVLSLATSNLLIGMDSDPMMACRLATLPALNIIGSLTVLSAFINALYLFRGPARQTSAGRFF